MSVKKRIKGLGVILAAMSTLFASACGGSSGEGGGTSVKGGVLTIANNVGALWTCSFNPFNAAVSFLSTGNIYEPLVFVNALQDEKTSPWLATAWRWSNGDKTMTFTIRDGVKWNDGQPFSAADVLFTLNLVKKFPALDLNSIWAVIASVKQQGSNQIVVNFKRPATPYFYYIADQLPIVPQHVWSSISDPVHYKDDKPVGTGAYTVSPCTPQSITYLANRGYWQAGLPKVTKVLYPAFTDNGPANTYLATGQAQWGSQFIPNIANFYLKRSKDHHRWSPPVNAVTLFPNNKVEPLNDPVVRRALAYATDRQKAGAIGENGQEPAANQLGVVTPTYQSWIDPAVQSQNDFTYNPAKARQVLEAAGYKKGPDGIYVSPKGKRLEFHVINNGGYSDWVAALQVVAQGMQAAGIKLTVDNLSQDDFTDKLYNGKFDLAYYAESGGPAPYYELRQWLYGANSAAIGERAATNYERYLNPAVDKLFDQYAATSDKAVQKQVIAKIQEYMIKDVPVIPVTEGVSWYEYDTSKFTGWVTEKNPYALPGAGQYPDMGQVLLHLSPK